MKKLFVVLALAWTACAPASAQFAPTASVPARSQVAPKEEPDEAKLQSHHHYRNKSGQEVHSPSKSTDGKVPSGATAQCRDGSYSFSRTHRGTCSHHGGVASWL